MTTVYKMVWRLAAFGLLMIAGAGDHVIAQDACLTEVLSEETPLGADLSETGLDCLLQKEIHIENIQVELDKENKLLKNIEYDLPLGIEPEGVFQLKAPVIAQKKHGPRYWIRETTPVKYAQPDGLAYKIMILKGTMLIQQGSEENMKYVLDAGNTVQIIPPRNIQSTLTVGAKSMLERLFGSGSRGTTITVEPDRAPVEGYITLTVARTGVDFANAQFQVCLRSQETNEQLDKALVASKEVELKEVQRGKAILQARIPEIKPGSVDILVAAYPPDDTIVEAVTHEFAVSSRFWAVLSWIAAAFIPWFIAALVTGHNNPNRRFSLDPIWFVSGKYGGASLSLAQILLWTILVFSASFYVLVASGKLLDLSDEVLVLLGIAGTTSVIAKITAAAKNEKGKMLTRELCRDPKWTDLVKTGGGPDLYKFQMGLFTILAAFFVIGKIYKTFEFPALPSGLLTLIGISNGVYLAAKATSQSVFEKLLEKHRELEDAKQEVQNLKEKLIDANDRLVAAENKKKKSEEERNNAQTDLTNATDEVEKEKQEELLRLSDEALKKAVKEWQAADGLKKEADDAVKAAEERVVKLQTEFDRIKAEATK